jgi:hypothetical protein
VPPLTREAKNNLLQWLKFVDTSSLLNDTRQKHTKGTGAWFIDGHFDEWKTSPHSFLWLYGKGMLLEYICIWSGADPVLL